MILYWSSIAACAAGIVLAFWDAWRRDLRREQEERR